MGNIHIKVKQNVGQEFNVPPILIKKLYNLLKKQQQGMDSWDCEPESIQGSIKTGFTYDIYVTALRNYFGDNLRIETDGYYIYFEDPLVESTIVDILMPRHYPTQNYEGVIPALSEYITSGNNQTIGFSRIFYADGNNDCPGKHITSFDELSKFNHLLTLAEGEFRGCRLLESVDLTRIKTINNGAFRGCNNLTYFNGRTSPEGELRLPNLTYNGLKEGAFAWYTENNISYGAKVKRIMDLGELTQLAASSFYRCKTLEYIDSGVLERLETIATQSFENCTNLTVDIWNTPYVRDIGYNTFLGCENLVIDDLKLPSCTRIGNSAFKQVQVKKISEIALNATIEGSVFANCSRLTEVTDEFFANILSLGESAFSNCTNLVIEELKLPNLSSIGKNAFQHTKVKKIIEIGPNVKTIQGFNDCSQLTEVYLPNNIEALGENAFYNSPSVNISDFISRSLIYNNGVFYNNFTLPAIIHYKPEIIGITPFVKTSVRSIYMPNVKNTNGVNGTEVPHVGRNTPKVFAATADNSNTIGNNIYIVYFKNLQKINGGFFGGYDWHDVFSYDLPTDDLRHKSGNTWIDEFRPIDPIPAKPHTDPYNSSKDNRWANAKYVIFNILTPPEYWQSYTSNWGGGPCASIALYQQKNSTIETFHQIAVPRDSIDLYLNWDAWGTAERFNSEQLKSTKRIDSKVADNITLTNLTKFDNSDPNNPRIIALESMGHFDTKAQYDAAPLTPPAVTEGHEGESGYGDGIHAKDEFLIVEYMGLSDNETIDWDPYPTWSPHKYGADTSNYTWYKGLITEELLQNQNYINSVSLNKNGNSNNKPTKIAIQKGNTLLMFPINWNVPEFAYDNSFNDTKQYYTGVFAFNSNPTYNVQRQGMRIYVLKSTNIKETIYIRWK